MRSCRFSAVCAGIPPRDDRGIMHALQVRPPPIHAICIAQHTRPCHATAARRSQCHSIAPTLAHSHTLPQRASAVLSRGRASSRHNTGGIRKHGRRDSAKASSRMVRSLDARESSSYLHAHSGHGTHSHHVRKRHKRSCAFDAKAGRHELTLSHDSSRRRRGTPLGAMGERRSCASSRPHHRSSPWQRIRQGKYRTPAWRKRETTVRI